MRVALAVLACTALAACRPEPVPVAAPSPEPTDTTAPPPTIVAVSAGKRLSPKRVEYRIRVVSDSLSVYVPMSLVVATDGAGKGSSAWSAESPHRWTYDAAADKFIAGAGEPLDEHRVAAFPASPIELAMTAEYAGPFPASEPLVLTYRAVPLHEFATRAYVPEKIVETNISSKLAHTPLGPRLRDVQAWRWLGSGFFVRDDAPPRSARIVVPGPKDGS